ncbi:MAG: DinB family protein [Chloroflexi bacterium]|nr:DinB family protein [Chloroflexota bacterium]
MNRGEIELLFQYNDWANQRILDRAEKVSTEQLTARNEFGWGSLRGALVHLMDAEYVWRILLNGGVFSGELKPEDFADVSAIRARWAEERAAFWDYLNSLSDDDLAGTVSYEGDGIMRHRVLWHCLAHVVNHGTQHRSECAALLTGFGHSPGNLDFTVFLSER